MTKLVSWIVAMTLLLAAGVTHGLWRERWSPSDALQDAAARVEAVPLEVGEWQGMAIATDAESFAMAGARAYWVRTYTHRYDGSSVLAILMCGRTGRMAVHTPEVCYRGAGYDLIDAPVRTVLRDEADEEAGTLWTARFAKQGASSDLRLYWGWDGGNRWQAPANPRWEFRGRPYLYKLYVSQELSGSTEPDHAANFLRQLLPMLRDVLGSATP